MAWVSERNAWFIEATANVSFLFRFCNLQYIEWGQKVRILLFAAQTRTTPVMYMFFCCCFSFFSRRKTLRFLNDNTQTTASKNMRHLSCALRCNFEYARGWFHFYCWLSLSTINRMHPFASFRRDVKNVGRKTQTSIAIGWLILNTKFITHHFRGHYCMINVINTTISSSSILNAIQFWRITSTTRHAWKNSRIISK